MPLLFGEHVHVTYPHYVYLGVPVHETRGLMGASDALAVSGSKAMHAMLTQCRRSCLTLV
jgi:hypothetical protein